ncbi:hypothetical protein, partial [Pantoea ananatis]|uniref:hypothetical protein n=2 Tax=Erwiniaceae TaxID=1903409 RepID=UPI0023AEA551
YISLRCRGSSLKKERDMVVLYNMTVKLEHIIVWTAVFQVANIWVDLCISRKRFLTRFFSFGWHPVVIGLSISSV